MAKAIPVFRFAFAAYAASGGAAAREKRDAEARRSGRQSGFLQSWSVFSSANGLMVKIGVRDAERCEAIAEPKGPQDDYREIWLSGIKETASAFSGVVRGSAASLRHIRPGQRIGFDPTHIIDWSIGCASSEDCAPECATKALCELVSS